LDVGKYSPNIVAAFQDSNGLIGIGGGDCFEAGRFNHFQSANPYKTFVLNDKHDRFFAGNRGPHSCTTTQSSKEGKAFSYNVAQFKTIQGLA
jgi:hypothetical protein